MLPGSSQWIGSSFKEADQFTAGTACPRPGITDMLSELCLLSKFCGGWGNKVCRYPEVQPCGGRCITFIYFPTRHACLNSNKKMRLRIWRDLLSFIIEDLPQVIGVAKAYFGGVYQAVFWLPCFEWTQGNLTTNVRLGSWTNEQRLCPFCFGQALGNHIGHGS
jgi:hypothetical protein